MESYGAVIEPVQWIKSNMLENYSEKLGRSFTEAELRVQRCLQQLSVPDWYTQNKKPCKFLKNGTPIESRPSSWKVMKIKGTNSPRKTPKKKTPKNTPRKIKESTRTSMPDSGVNATYRIRRKTPKKDKSSWISPSSSEAESDTPQNESVRPYIKYSNTPLRNPNVSSNTFPRITPSRKISNINILFEKPFPSYELDDLPEAEIIEPTSASITPKADVLSDDDSMDYGEDTNDVTITIDKNPDHFFTDDVEFKNIGPHYGEFVSQVDTDTDTENDEEEESYVPYRPSPSPDTQFFNSHKKSTALEKIVQSKRSECNRSVVQEIIGELSRSIIETPSLSSASSFGDSQGFIKSMIDALTYVNNSSEEEEDGQSSTGSTDSELAKSTTLSYKSYDSADEGLSNFPLPQCPASDNKRKDEESVYWIHIQEPIKIEHIDEGPRTSSRLSMLSRASSRSSSRGGYNAATSSPGLSPIKKERHEEEYMNPNQITKAWNRAFNSKVQRQLFKIDETGGTDSGFSDKSSTSSRALWSNYSTMRSSPDSLISESPTFNSNGMVSSTLLSKAGPFVFDSFMV